MSINQKGKKRQVWMSLGLAGVLVTNGSLPYAVPANEVQAMETTQSERETKVTTIPAGSTFASIFPSSKLALQVAMEIYPQTHPDKIDVKKEVTQAELDRVTIIEDDPALGDPIGNIEGVQYLRNLEDLWVGIAGDFRGKVENLDVLSNLTKLKVLAVKNQAISDISGIKNLTNLTYLNLTDNKITDAGPIAGLTKLEFISLYVGNNIQSLAPFQQLAHLKKLYLSASVSDFRPLQHLPLIQDASNTWELRGEVQLPDAYVGEPVFMQAFDPTGQQVAYGSVYLDDKWQGLDAYQNNHVIWTKQGTVGSVTFTQRPVGATDYSRYIRVDFKQRVLPAKATVQPVTVRYVDDQGEVLAPEERLNGVLGEAYAAQAKTIDGYQLTKEPANRVGTFSTEAQTVTFVYIKEAVPVSQSVTVRHLDTEGKMIAPDEVLTGAVGDTYEAQAKVVLGYRLVTTPANQTGTFGTEAQTVTFIYA
ncbi:MucBP domain-containing protein, partial [Listeria booriae]|uniref:MucBP domain-containing protein n=1 Tax=Listeria booriae TaxID=1552123 RepID=UPI0016240D69